MKNLIVFTILTATFAACTPANRPAEVIKNNLRPPAYPLVTIDPYTSAWSFTDQLYDGEVRHWTGEYFPLTGAVRVDGKLYRFMGKTPWIPVAQMAEKGSWAGRYSLSKPQDGWQKTDFNDSKWATGAAAFGTPGERAVQTIWKGDHTEIWVRREITLDEDLTDENLFLEYSHDDDFELYINGVEVVHTGDAWWKNKMVSVPEAAVRTLKKGKNVMAAHCLNRTRDALVDFGLWYDPVKKQMGTAAVQQSADVQATQTRYRFTCGPVDLHLAFTAPLLMNDLELVSRPVNYIAYEVTPTDGQAHQVEIYFEASPAWALDKPDQESQSEAYEKDGLVFLKTGSVAQKILGKSGDNVRIDWGYFYMAAEKEETGYALGNETDLRAAFGETGQLPSSAKTAANARVAITRSLGKVEKTVSGKVMIGYDDLYSIQYFGENLRPYWNRDGNRTIESLFAQASAEYPKLKADCDRFDRDLMTRATRAGGKEYAELCALAYRQAIAAHKLAQAPNGDLLFLSKENSSNGSIGTVDVAYPSAPLFLLYNVELVKGLLNPIFYYAESGKWTNPFAPHDVGSYPLANGGGYPMPVEESGNMLILAAAIAAIEGNAKYAEKHWQTLATWADYLVGKGLDPENQLCTDDFTGHIAHNANLSVKAILGVASYGRMAEMLGKKDLAEKYTALSRRMAVEWTKMADDGDHYRLAFDQPGTWSQKYNLVWDKVMNLDIFPAAVAEKEIAYYLAKQNQYGLPLDSRFTWAKSDWLMWTAALAADKATFEQFIRPLHAFMNETVTRTPMSDWYYTDQPNQRRFRARSVVGGYFIKMLKEEIRK